MQQELNVARDNAISFRIPMLDALSCPPPFTEFVPVVRCLNNATVMLFVSETVVGNGHYHGLMQEWPLEECPASNHLLCDFSPFEAFVLAVDKDDHGGISTVGTVDVHTMETELRVMRKSLHRRETCKSGSTEMHSLEQTIDKLDAITQRWRNKWLHFTFVGDQVREYARK